MATFADRTLSGAAVHATLTPRRSKIHFDKTAMRLTRARTFAAYQLMGLSIAQTSAILNWSESTISADLAWLAAQRAAGKDNLPTDPIDPETLD
ncbi:MAG: hypothetical protein JWN86_3599 [Planctomycetota bacterium]|nr:hypothetical protein [Planctomycetota bacterium]